MAANPSYSYCRRRRRRQSEAKPHSTSSFLYRPNLRTYVRPTEVVFLERFVRGGGRGREAEALEFLTGRADSKAVINPYSIPPPSPKQ